MDGNDDLKKMLSQLNLDSRLDSLMPDESAKDIVEYSRPVEFVSETKAPISLGGQLDDYNFARNSLISTIEKGNIALNEILRVAGASDHPRAYEVVSTLMKTITDSSEGLLKLQMQMVNMRKKMQADKASGDVGVTEDGAFEGTIEELLIEEEENEKASKIEGK